MRTLICHRGKLIHTVDGVIARFLCGGNDEATFINSTFKESLVTCPECLNLIEADQSPGLRAQYNEVHASVGEIGHAKEEVHQAEFQ